jgi:hypothetical protein
MTTPGNYWGADVPISMPEPSNDDVLIDMGAVGFSENGLVHNLNSSDLEEYQIPTFGPGGTIND